MTRDNAAPTERPGLDSADDPMVTCDRLLKIYQLPGQDGIALQGLQLSIARGERVGIIGTSGSGKSTLLNVLGALVRPTAGTVVVDGIDLLAAGTVEQDRYRRSTVGFVWQQSSRNLVPFLSARDNVALPVRAGGGRQRRRLRTGTGRRRQNPEQRADELLAMVGLADRKDHLPAQLSGGEQQRVAIAVALANEPSLLLADEPTGELDSATAIEIYDLLAEVTERTGLTQVIVSHDPDLARHVDRVVAVGDGRIVSEHRMVGDHGLANDGAAPFQRYSTVDRFGQVQLSGVHREALGIDGLVSVTVDGDELRLRAAPKDEATDDRRDHRSEPGEQP
jgi:ABC-type lipoprotein export system ATPase subunit